MKGSSDGWAASPHFALLQKQLVDALIPQAKHRHYAKGTKLSFVQKNAPFCHILISGTVDVYRITDSLLLTSLSTSHIMGLATHDIYAVVTSPAQIASISLEDVCKHIARQNLWQTFAEFLLAISHKIYLHAQGISAPTTYEVICNQLVLLMESPIALRQNVTAVRFICERSHLSRSLVMKVLSDLKKGDYIEMKKGELIAINFLPARY
jgi:CRP-like cAMP-binding protein